LFKLPPERWVVTSYRLPEEEEMENVGYRGIRYELSNIHFRQLTSPLAPEEQTDLTAWHDSDSPAKQAAKLCKGENAGVSSLNERKGKYESHKFEGSIVFYHFPSLCCFMIHCLVLLSG